VSNLSNNTNHKLEVRNLPIDTDTCIINELIFDYAVVTLLVTDTPTTSSTSSTNSQVSTAGSKNSNINGDLHHTINKGAIEGGVIGDLAALLLLTASLVYLNRRKRWKEPPVELHAKEATTSVGNDARSPASTSIDPLAKMHRDFARYEEMRQSTVSPSQDLFSALGGEGSVEPLMYQHASKTTVASPPPSTSKDGPQPIPVIQPSAQQTATSSIT
jgi:hypothetical protein